MKKMKENPARTVLTISMGIMVIYFLFPDKLLLYFAFVIGMTGVLSTFLSIRIEKMWMKLAWGLGLVVPNLVLGMFFYAVIFPISLLSRLFKRKDNLVLRNRAQSLFVETKKRFDKTSFEKPW